MSFFRKKQEPKVFCVGLGKTGTTSITKSLSGLGFRMGKQRDAELLLDAWAARHFAPIIRYCETAEAFQDVPFSLPFTFQALDQAYPGSRFVLTVRDNAESWYQSLTRFHSKRFADGSRIPTADDLKRAFYREEGYVWRSFHLLYGTPESDPYEKGAMLAFYDRHVANVTDYFRHRPDDLLVINVAIPDDYRRLCDFLGRTPAGDTFPWLNKT